MLLKNLLSHFISYAQWMWPAVLFRMVLELLHRQFELPNYGQFCFWLAAYMVVVTLVFAWLLYDGTYRSGRFWIDPRRPY